MSRHSKLLESIIKYTTAAVLIAIPLYPKFPFIRISGTFVSIRLEDLLIAFSFFLVIYYFLESRGKFQKKDLFVSVILYLITGGISLMSAIFVTKTVTPHIAILHWMRRVEYFVPLFLGIAALKKRPQNIDFYFKVLLLVLFFIFIYGLGQRYLQWPIVITQNEEYSKGVALRFLPGSHINSTFAGHYDLATFLVLILPILVCALFLLKEVKVCLVLLFSWLSSLWLLVNTASRISLFSYAVSVTLALIFVKRYKAIPLVLAVSILFSGFSPNLLARYMRIFEVGKSQLKNIVINKTFDISAYAQTQEIFTPKRQRVGMTPTPIPVFEDRSTNIRLNVEWPRAVRAFFKNPLLGTGYSSITLATDNDYLRALGEVGLLGFFAFGLIFINVFQKLIKVLAFSKHFQPKEGHLLNNNELSLAFAAGISGALPGIFINAFFIDVFEASKFAVIFWLLTGMTMSLISSKK